MAGKFIKDYYRRSSGGAGYGTGFSGSGMQANIDAGIGLIYRLNDLMKDADNYATAGDFDKWNFILDRIYCNLTYRNPMELVENDANEIEDVRMTEKDVKVFRKFAEEIKEVKLEKIKALKAKDTKAYNEASNKHYWVLLLKDIWLKKFMHELGLYLREVEVNPSSSLFGGV